MVSCCCAHTADGLRITCLPSGVGDDSSWLIEFYGPGSNCVGAPYFNETGLSNECAPVPGYSESILLVCGTVTLPWPGALCSVAFPDGWRVWLRMRAYVPLDLRQHAHDCLL